MKVLFLLQIAAVLLMFLSVSTTEGKGPRVDLYGGYYYRAVYEPCNPSIPDGGYSLANLRTSIHYVVCSEENYEGECRTLTDVGVKVDLGFTVRSAHVLLPDY